MRFGPILCLAIIAVGLPNSKYATAIEPREDVSVQDYGNMKFYAQHAAAAYCNFDAAVGIAITCRNGGCRDVEMNMATVVGSTVGRRTGVGAYVAVDSVRKEIVLSVRGSNNIRNFLTDIDFPWQDCDLVASCKVHKGFAHAWTEIEDTMTGALHSAWDQNPGYRLIVTGHSLGGAVATLAGGYLRRGGFPVDVYTYGSPRVGNDHFANWMTKREQGRHWRVTHLDDPVPRLAPLALGYRHVSPEYWLSGGWPSQDNYPISQVRICYGIDNVNCNGGTWGLPNVVSHLHYLGNTAACTGIPILWKRDMIANGDDEQRLSKWSQKDQKFNACGNLENSM